MTFYQIVIGQGSGRVPRGDPPALSALNEAGRRQTAHRHNATGQYEFRWAVRGIGFVPVKGPWVVRTGTPWERCPTAAKVGPGRFYFNGADRDC